MPDGSTINPADFPPASTIRPNPDYVPAYIAEPATWFYDLDPANGISRASYPGEVYAAGLQLATKADIAAATTGVSTFNTRSGAVVLTLGDVTTAGGAPINSPTFAGVPNAPTPAPGDNTTKLATTMFVTGAISAAAGVASWNGRQGAVTLTLGDVTTAGGAPLASPALTGTPTAPTASVGVATGQIASTQFVANAIAGGAVVSWNGRLGAVTMTLSDITSAGGAPLASPAFTGVPTVPTATPGTSTVQAASTAFVTNAVTAATGGVASFNTRTGAVTLLLSDVTGVGGAPLLSPALTGTPTAPTATAGTSTTQLATTAFVQNAVTGLPGVASFNGRQGAVTLQLADVTSVGGAPLASPALSGTPTGTTPPPGDNSTRLATTSFVVTSFAPLASPALTGTPTVPTAAPGTSTTQAASTAFVQAAGAMVTQATYDNVGRNLLHNGQFNIGQRGAGPFTMNGVYTADRWFLTTGGDTTSIVVQNLTDTDRTQIGDEAARVCLQNVYTGSASAAAYSSIEQRVESVRRLSGKTVTLSFWAISSVAGLKLGINAFQWFGTGGSPSTYVQVLTTGLAVTIGVTWARYNVTIALPSAAAKVLGTNGDDATWFRIYYTSGATNNQIAGNIGVQSGVVNLWAMQLEVGSVATPLEHIDPRIDLDNCLRFFQTNVVVRVDAATPPGAYGVSASIALPVLMRALPTVAVISNASANVTGLAATALSAGVLNLSGTTAGGGYALYGGMSASADL